MLKWNSRHMTSFAKETVEYLLWIFHKQLSLHLARLQRPTRWTVVLLLIRIDPWLVTCDDLINVFWSTAIVFFQHFFTPNDINLFWPIVKLCEIQRQQIFLTAWCSCNIEFMLVEEMPKGAFISRYVTWRSSIISSRTSSMFSDTVAVFERSLRT